MDKQQVQESKRDLPYEDVPGAVFKADIHMHSEHSHDGKHSVVELSEAALEKGLQVIGITDHADVPGCMGKEYLKMSVADAKAADAQYEGRLQVLAGIELGCSFANPEYCRELVETGGYDLVIHSVHALRYKETAGSHRFFNIGDMTDAAIHECMSNYFADVMRAMEAVKGDVVAHLTCPLRYINGVYKRNLDLEPHEQEIRKILQYIISHEVALEVNSSNRGGYGDADGYGELMPNEWILRMYHDMGGELLTFGSDAHVTEKIYHYGEETARLLREIGFRHLYYYKGRRPISYDIV